MRTIISKGFASVASFVLLGSTAVPFFVTGSAAALVGAHSYTDTTTGDVFLGGDYIEVGVSSYGSFGTDSSQPKPSGFYGTASRDNIGMSSNAAGFGESPDTSIDYFLPGTPEERWVVGYKQGGTPVTGSNSLLMGAHDISDYAVTNKSTSTQLEADGSGTFDGKLKISQDISFKPDQKFFKNVVTLKNVTSSNLDSVRFMRTFDPDNTRDQGGRSATQNTVLYTQAAGDGKAVVVADTSNNTSDPVFLVNGSHSPILFYSTDPRARVSTYGFSNDDPYAVDAYDSAPAKGYSLTGDRAITITADAGTLTPGQSTTFTYYTSLDNGDINDVLASIAAGDTDNIDDATEDAGPNNGDGNGDGVRDSQQPNVTSLPNTVLGNGKYETLETSGCNTITNLAVKDAKTYGADGAYNYPLGLTDFTVTCPSAGDTAHIKIYYDQQYDTSHWTARKVINGRFTAIPGATFGTATVGSNKVTTLSYDVTDGGPLDADGTANGTVVDPAGPALTNGSSVSTATATAPNTGFEPKGLALPILASLAGLMTLASAFVAKRRTRDASNI